MHAPLSLIAGALIASTLAGQISQPQHVIYQIEGPNASSWYGDPVEGGIGDIDKDGYPDFAAGAPHRHLFIYSGKDGTTMYQFSRNDGGLTQNGRIRAAGDVNRDGFMDILVGATTGGAGTQGRVYVLSGDYIVNQKAPEILYTLDGEVTNDQHSNPGRVGDVNKDGHDDILIGAPGFDDTTNSLTDGGKVYVYSGKDGKLLYSRTGAQAGQFLGSSVDGAGDINLDTYPDIVMTSYGWAKGSSAQVGLLEVISGKYAATQTGPEVLYSFEGEFANDRLGGWYMNAIEAGIDVDRDGWPDIAVGANGFDGSGTDVGRVYLLSGKYVHLKVGKEVLFQWTGTVNGMRLGSDVNIAEDIDGDTWPDIIAGAPSTPRNAQANIGRAIVWSGRDGRKLFEVDGELQNGNTTGQYLGWRCDGVGDVNKDGFGDIAVGAWNWGVPRGIGRCYILSGKELMLATDEHLHTLTGSTTQKFSLAAGASNANRQFILATSLGKGPIPLGAISVPLTPGPWFNTALPQILSNSPFFSGWTGTLDSAGKASTAWTLPANNDPTLVGLSLWQAYIVWHKTPGGDVFDAASNPVPLTMVR